MPEAQRIEAAMAGKATGEVGRNQIIMNSYFHDEVWPLNFRAMLDFPVGRSGIYMLRIPMNQEKGKGFYFEMVCKIFKYHCSYFRKLPLPKYWFSYTCLMFNIAFIFKLHMAGWR